MNELKSAIKCHITGKIYHGNTPGTTHAGIADKHGFLDDNVFHNPNKECGYTDESGKFLNRTDAYKHAHQNFLLHKIASQDANEMYHKNKKMYDRQRLDTTDLKYADRYLKGKAAA